MSIQLYKDYPQVRIGTKFFPAKIHGKLLPEISETMFTYEIPLGDSGRSISVAIGYGSYSDNRDKKTFDPFAPMDRVEIAPLDCDGEFILDEQVIGFVNDKILLGVIKKFMPKTDTDS